MNGQICSECFKQSDDLRDINEVLVGRVREWVASGKYKLGEYAEACGTSSPKGFVATWDGSEGVHFICKNAIVWHATLMMNACRRGMIFNGNWKTTRPAKPKSCSGDD